MDAQDFMPSDAALATLRAEIEAYEAERRKICRDVRWRIPAYMATVVVTVVILALAFNAFADPNELWFSAPHVFLYVAGAIGLIVAYFVGSGPERKLQQSYRDRLLPIIFAFIENVRYQRGDAPASVERLPRETIGEFNQSSYDDEISGSWQGFPFELYEAVFSQKSGGTTSTVFRGVVVALETDILFPGVLVATRKANKVTSFFRGMFGKNLHELSSGIPDLDAAYDFRTDNPEAARPLVTGPLAQALQWLGEAWPEEPARIALKDKDAFLLLPQSKNFFELPDISVPLDYKTHIAPMIADMASLLATGALVRKIG
ncbi:MAG: DUF3137 domain-containing protein [Rhizobiaceae bacterium]